MHAAESSPEVSIFFGGINRLYTLVSASPVRWAIYKDKTGCSLHYLSDTCWSARIEAVKSVAKHLPCVINALDSILLTCILTSEARSEASGLKNYFMSFNANVLLTVWLKILQCIEDRNVILQSGKISLDTQAASIRALKEEMQALRDGWKSLLSEATLISMQMDVEPQFSKEHSHQRKRKRFHDETSHKETAQDSAVTVFREHSVFYCYGQHHK